MEHKEKYVDLESKQQQNQQTSKSPHPLEEFMWKGVTCFLVVASCIIFGVVVLRFDAVLRSIQVILNVLEPILCGLIFAYLLNPIMNKVEKFLLHWCSDRRKITSKIKEIVRGISIFITIVFALVAIVVLLAMVIPELITSIGNMIKDLPEQFHAFNVWFSKEYGNKEVAGIIGKMTEEAGVSIEKWIKTDLLKQMNVLVSKLTVGVFGIVNFVEVFFVGIIVSIYVLANKEKFIGQSKKLLYAVLSENVANTTMDLLRDSHRIFIGFITGKVIDSFIIGVLCFLGLSLLRMPYTLIVSVVVGVTNVIPFFGPYMGAIAGGILIALASPKAAIVFLIFVLFLQQFDGNILGPKILGESTGLSAFWVIFAIMVGSGLFGFAGMVFGVPTFAVIYHIIRELINKRLEVKKLPTDTNLYHKMERIADSHLVIPKENTKDENNQKEKG